MSPESIKAAPKRVQVNTRVPEDLFLQFQATCLAQDITVSQRLRQLMRAVVRAQATAPKDAPDA